jgi:predicted ATPase/DNA-binding CsgD family transcriptional regulator
VTTASRVTRRPIRSPDEPRHNLPARRPALIGRGDDAAAVGQLLLDEAGRLVTLVGTGGCGKTQLALDVATTSVPRFTDGVWLVDLAPVRDPVLLPYALAAALGCRERAGEAVLDTLLAFLASRQLLLVLDNCEHLIESCAALAGRVLDACSNVRLLATSREPMRIANETAWRVPSLAVPDPGSALEPAELLAYPAIRLFVERAHAVKQNFTLGVDNASDIAAICTRLEGLPLAIELAAARVRALSVRQILERLADSFSLLVGGSRTAPTRQQTLRATLDWSHNLLADPERAVFRCLAVFAGGWSLEAAEAVCNSDGKSPPDVLELLTRLVDKSLVVADEQASRSRYRLLEPIGQYAYARLAESGDLNDARRRHAAFCLTFAEALERDANVGGLRRQAATDGLAAEYRNLQAALSWCIETQEAQLGLRLARALQFQWKHYGPYGEGLRWIAELLGLPDAAAPTPARAVALLTAAHLEMVLWNDRPRMCAVADEAVQLARHLDDPWILFAALAEVGIGSWHMGDLDTARSNWEEALAIASANGDEASEAAMLINLGRLVIYLCKYDEGRAQCEAGLRHGHTLGDTWLVGMALTELGWAGLAQDDLSTARACAQDCLSLAPQDPIVETTVLTLLGIVETAEGRYADARAHLTRSLARQHELGLTWFIPDTLEGLAGLAYTCGQPVRALQLAGAASAVRTVMGVPGFPLKRHIVDRWLGPLRSKFGNTELSAGRMSDGLALSLDAAVRLALSESDREQVYRRESAQDSPGRLTPRQQAVAELVAYGLTNRQIAEQLVITERGVASHIEHILNKLGVVSRTQIGVWVAERGLLTRPARSETPSRCS